MLTRNIYLSALRLLDEGGSEEENLDYEERAPYILGNFCSNLKSTDKMIREAEGLEKQTARLSILVGLDESFPLCDELAPLGALYLAAMLVIDSDEALYERLFDRYCDSLACITSGMCARLEKITNCYS